eukprot:2084383-Rhodomonas_salina.1
MVEEVVERLRYAHDAWYNRTRSSVQNSSTTRAAQYKSALLRAVQQSCAAVHSDPVPANPSLSPPPLGSRV